MTPSLYQEIVLDHYRNPRNRGALAQSTHAADGVNPLCGDALRIEVRCIDGRIAELRFSGDACAITTATASMLSELVTGREIATLEALQGPFERLIRGEADECEVLGPLNALGEIRRYPSRRKCALLPWATLHAALAGSAKTSTETP